MELSSDMRLAEERVSSEGELDTAIGCQIGLGDAAGEPERLAALRRYKVLDTPEEEAFERIVALARDIFDVPMAVVTLVDGARQWFKARVGVEMRETPREWSFCHHALGLHSGEVFVVPDAAADPRFAANPLVVGEPRLRFYAGAPLVTPDGYSLGAVAVISPEPRPAGLSGPERRRLCSLAALAADELELRLQTRLSREAAARAEAARAAEAAVRASEARLWALVNAMPECIMVVARDGRLAQVNPAGLHLLGAEAAADVEGRPACGLVVPEHRDTWTANHRRVCAGETIAWDFDITGLHGARRHVQVHSVPLWPPAEEGAAHLAVARDITERKRAEERQTLLAREVDHRAKNALAVVQATLRLTRAPDLASYLQVVEGRIATVARAQTLLAEGGWNGTDLRTLVLGELAPFPVGHRVRCEGPSVVLPPDAAQPLAMVIHELAMNAVKHGALSVPDGRISVTWHLDDTPPKLLRIRWVEQGGPPVAGQPGRRGFGTRMLTATIHGQLCGLLSLSWEASGLVCSMDIPLLRSRPAEGGVASTESRSAD
jgi:PAS domain S-box-containing protein